MNFQEKPNQTLSANFLIPIRYDEYITENKNNETIVILHGFGQTKERIFKSIGKNILDLAQRVLVLNGPFPMPYQDKEGLYQESYAWYFHLFKQNICLIPAANCEPFFEIFIKNLNLKNTNTTIIGFSQGGFIMPHMAKYVPNLKQMIGISCGVADECLDWLNKKNPLLHIIHGEQDTQSDITTAEKKFLEVKNNKKLNKFIKVTGEHGMDKLKIEHLKKLILI